MITVYLWEVEGHLIAETEGESNIMALAERVRFEDTTLTLGALKNEGVTSHGVWTVSRIFQRQENWLSPRDFGGRVVPFILTCYEF